MSFTKEATYVFSYDGLQREVVASVDNITNTRFIESEVFDYGYGNSLNYKGSGATDFPTIEAVLVSEDIKVYERGDKMGKLLYHLPDVDAYVVVGYQYMPPVYWNGQLDMPETKEFKKIIFLMK
ncbi:hypothetical protein ABE178_15975 [Priestia megaterium]